MVRTRADDCPALATNEICLARVARPIFVVNDAIELCGSNL